MQECILHVDLVWMLWVTREVDISDRYQIVVLMLPEVVVGRVAENGKLVVQLGIFQHHPEACIHMASLV
jgi:hypothetical protein